MRRNSARCFALMIVALFVLGSLPAYAAGRGKIVEFTLKDNQLMAFVKNADDTAAIQAALGRTACDDVYFQTIPDAGTKIYTLILIDNSLSIPEDSRSAIRTELLEWIAARKGNEAFAIGTVSSQVSIVRDFTDDYVRLKESIESIEYQNQEVYLTDALYDYLVTDPFQANDADVFFRILLISDGADNKTLGYTKDELQSLLKERPIPIYAIGVGGETSANNEALEYMFALARATGGEALLLQDLNNTTSIMSVMEADWNNLVVTVEIPESAKDGSLQTLTITLHDQEGGSTVVSQDSIRMPLATVETSQVDEPSESIPAEGNITEDITPTTNPEDKTQAEKELPFPLIAGGAAVAVVLIIIIIIVAIVLGRRKKAARKEAAAVPQFTAKESMVHVSPREAGIQRQVDREADGTQYLEESGTSNATVQLWGQDEICRITLTDIHSPEKFYQVSMGSSLIIGASIESDICVNYDRTVSRTHCEIVWEGGELFLINHSQSNGTLLNGVRVVSKTPLTSGSIITMGRVEMRIEIDG